MMDRHKDVSTIVVAVLVGLSTALPGCATLARMGAAASGERVIRAQPEPLPPPSSEALEPTTLAAVEAFLEQTEAYQLPDTTLSPTPLPAPAKTRRPVREHALRAERGPVPADSGTPDAADATFANMQMVLAAEPAAQLAPALPVLEWVSIRSDSIPVDEAVEPVKTKAANESLDARPADPSMQVDRFLAHLKRRAAARGDFDSEWQLRLAQLAFYQDVEAVEVASPLPPSTRETVTALLRAVLAVRRIACDPLQGTGLALQRIDELRRAVADHADPVVATVALCRKVVTFGVYEEMKDEDFVAGRSIQTIVYSEIRHFRSERTEPGRFRTRLGTRVEVLTADGASVWEREEPEIIDLCRRRRSDFFIAQRVSLPPTLPAGDYVLKVMVEDKLAEKASEATHPFTVHSALSLASRP